ncbi:MAG: hypothetical protein GY937_08805 [bacterium]|nr:hypothetical protein [bacterium]
MSPNQSPEIREDRVKAVQYCRFPRVCTEPQLKTAFTRDVSASGLCVRIEGSEPVGALLRLIPRGVDGEPEIERIGRVAWTRPAENGGRWVGIALLDRERHEPTR